VPQPGSLFNAGTWAAARLAVVSRLSIAAAMSKADATRLRLSLNATRLDERTNMLWPNPQRGHPTPSHAD